MDQLKRMMEKKKNAGKMHPLEKKAKMGVVEQLQKMAQNAMGDKLKGMNKAAPMGEDDNSYAEGGMTETHPMSALHQADGKDPMASMSTDEDDTNPDHEDFEGSENAEDGEDGMSAYPSAEGDNLLESDEEMHAMGGEIGSMYDHMDESMINEHLKHLLKRQKGLA